jgi:hypothetical protein
MFQFLHVINVFLFSFFVGSIGIIRSFYLVTSKVLIEVIDELLLLLLAIAPLYVQKIDLCSFTRSWHAMIELS